ncbi:MAG: ABC transporter ATP-binding protein [Bacteroidales bacterium]|nr:ABC transporter ATP-binding protein [Bacteroidales bacterium]
MIVNCQNISKSYGGIQAVESVSFDVEEGNIFGFLGPDGSGKTTLFRILTTLLLPDNGSARIDGFDVVKDFRKVRNIIGYMPGRFSLYSDLSIEENLDFFATVFGTTLKENYHLIRDIYVQIEPFKKRLAGRLSGGMKQKLALSCALIHQPKLLVLDEPTTGVDAVSRKEFWDLLIGLKEKGITIIISTPYMDEAGMCDQVALMQKGKILSCDKPDEIIRKDGQQLYSLKAENIYQLLKDLRKYPETDTVFPFGQDLHYTSKEKDPDLEKLKSYLKERGHEKLVLAAITPGIEDVFMHLMEKENPLNEKL